MVRDPRRPMRALLAAPLLLALLALPAIAQEPASSPVATTSPAAIGPTPSGLDEACREPEPSAPPGPDETLSMPEDFRIQLFEGVWQGIRDFYIDPEHNGLDWEAIGDEYAPLILQTDNAYEVYELLSEMVGLLEDPYTAFYAPDDLADPATVDPTYGGIGALLDESVAGEGSEGLRILYVFEGGSAEEAGIAPRDRIVGVDGDPCARIADIRGPQGTEVTLTIVSPGEAPRDVTLERRQIDPTIRPEARRLEADPTVGYLRLVSLAGQETIDAVEQALEGFAGEDPIEGLIIDVRATNQGAPGVVSEILRPFVAGEVGEFHTRVGSEPLVVEPNELAADHADVPLVVLVDEGSEAEAEQLAAILQDQGRATIVGEPTSGQTHGANTVDYPDGSVLQVVSFGFRLPDGRNLEGRGVTPDVLTEGDWLAVPESEDPGILAALEVIETALAADEGAAAASFPPAASPVGPPAADRSPVADRSPPALATTAPTAPTEEGSPAPDG